MRIVDIIQPYRMALPVAFFMYTEWFSMIEPQHKLQSAS